MVSLTASAAFSLSTSFWYSESFASSSLILALPFSSSDASRFSASSAALTASARLLTAFLSAPS